MPGLFQAFAQNPKRATINAIVPFKLKSQSNRAKFLEPHLETAIQGNSQKRCQPRTLSLSKNTSSKTFPE